MESKKYEDFEREAMQYKAILLGYKKTKKPFVDPNFHPTMHIKEREVFIDDSMDEWKRVDEICDAPLFQKDIISSDFVQQGELGDCFFLSALSRIAKQAYLVPPLFDRETPNQTLGRVKDSINLKCGAVVVYFNCFGRKTPVLIDTLLPMKYGQLRFSHPSDNKKSPWFCLVEKAFAKLSGSYSDIVGGTLPQAIYSLYGYYPQNKNFEDLEKPEKLAKMSVFDRIMKYQKKGAVMGTAINLPKIRSGVTNEEIESKGLIAGHCYLLLKAREHDGKRFLCLRNPWGDHEWNGDYSDESPKWTPELKEGLGWNPASDGTFWMLDRDYFRYFTTVEVSLPLPPEWYSRRFFVQLRPGEHDGYNVESSNAKIAERPNFAFQVTDPIPKGEKCRFHILVEKRHKLFDEKKGSIWSAPQYCVLIAHADGKKLSPNVLLHSNRFAMQSAMPLLSFAYDVSGNDDIVTIALHRLQSCNLIEDCYVLVYCEKDFKLYDIDHPDQLIPEEDNAGVVFDNFSTKHPDVANPLKKKRIKNKDVITFGEVTKNDFNSMREELLARYQEEIDAKKDEPVPDAKPEPKKKDAVKPKKKDFKSSTESDNNYDSDDYGDDDDIKPKEKAKKADDDDDIKPKGKIKKDALKAKDKEKEEALRKKDKEKEEAIKAKEKEKEEAIKAKEREKEEALREKDRETEEALNAKDQEINEANEEIERLRALLKSAQRQKKEKESLIKKMEENLKSQEEIDELKLQLENEKKQIALEKEKINSEKRRARKLIDDEVKRKIKENEEKKKHDEKVKGKKDEIKKSDDVDDDDEKPKEKVKAKKAIKKVDSSDDEDKPKPKPKITPVKAKKDDSDDENIKPKEKARKAKKVDPDDDEEKPKPKEKAKKVKKVDSDDDEEKPKPKPKITPAKAKKADPDDEDIKPKEKAKKKAEKVDSDEEEEKPKPKGAPKKAKKVDSDDEEEKPKPKPKITPAKAKKVDSDDEDIKPKEKAKKAAKKADSDDEEEKPKEKAKKATKKVDSDDEEEKPKPKEKAKKTTKKSDSSDEEEKSRPKITPAKPKKADSDDDEKPKPKEKAKKAAKKLDSDDEEEKPKEKAKKATKKVDSDDEEEKLKEKAKKAAKKVDSDDEEEKPKEKAKKADKKVDSDDEDEKPKPKEASKKAAKKLEISDYSDPPKKVEPEPEKKKPKKVTKRKFMPTITPA